jgi:hypothetical protein
MMRITEETMPQIEEQARKTPGMLALLDDKVISVHSTPSMICFREAPNLTAGQMFDLLMAHCASGDLNMIQAFFASGDLTPDIVRSCNCRAMRTACANGHLEVARWLWKSFGLTKEDIHADNDRIFMDTCTAGHLSVAKWLWSLFYGNTSKREAMIRVAFAFVCMVGDLPTAKWLFEISDGNTGSKVDNLNFVCLNKNSGAGLELVKWIVAAFGLTKDDIDKSRARIGAESAGNMEIIKWLDEHLGKTKPSTAGKTEIDEHLAKAKPSAVAEAKTFQCDKKARIPIVWPTMTDDDQLVLGVLSSGTHFFDFTHRGQNFAVSSRQNPLQAIEAHLAGNPIKHVTEIIEVPLMCVNPIPKERSELFELLGIQYIEWWPNGRGVESPRRYVCANRFDLALDSWEKSEPLGKTIFITIDPVFRDRYTGALPRAVKLLAPYFGIRYVERDGQFVVEVAN